MIWKFGRLPSTSINLPRRISTTHGNIGDCWMGCWVCLRYHHQEETLVHDCEAAMFVTVSWYQNRHRSYTVSKSSTISNAFLTKTIPQSKVSNEKQQNPHSKLFPGNWWFTMEILFLKNHQFLEVYKSSIQVFKIIQIPDVFLGIPMETTTATTSALNVAPIHFRNHRRWAPKLLVMLLTRS